MAIINIRVDDLKERAYLVLTQVGMDLRERKRILGHGLTNSLRIVGIIFIAFTVRNNKLGIHEFDSMAESSNFSSPVLRGDTGFDADETRFSLSEE